MIVSRIRNCRHHCLAVLALALLIPAANVFARGGGLHWGYRPPAGAPLTNYWRFASPYGALQGWGIPHHSLDAPRSHSGFSSSGISNSSSHLPTLDRSVMFPGSSSNTSTLIPSFHHASPAQPYETGKKYDPPYFHNYNGYWHHGYWGGGQWGWGRWGGHSGIWSVARWWLGPLYFTSGYGSYRNPFATERGATVPAYLNYANPLENIENDEEPSTSSSAPDQSENSARPSSQQDQEDVQKYLVKTPEVKAGLKSFDTADAAFRAARYDEALKHIDEALAQLPYDAALHEFRGLVLFALEEYQQAAATIYSVLSVSPGWDWTTLSSRYADHEDFALQLRKLETYHKQHPESAAVVFLLAYHYTTCRHTEAAVKQFETVVKLLPEDQFLPQLLSLVSADLEKPSLDPVAATRETETISSSDPQAESIAISTLIGDWRAPLSESRVIQLRLRKDQQFVWTSTQEGSARITAGQFAVAGDLLLLAGGSGTLVGRLQMQPGGGFQFKLLDDCPGDSGIIFRSVSGR